jgi:hypothetical protein
MTCPKCGAANADGVQFCTHCHATLLFKCPKCDHMQTHGGTCDACGLNMTDFWTKRLAIKRVEQENFERKQTEQELNNVQTAMTVPFSGPGGWAMFLLTAAIRRIGAWFESR